MVSTGLSDLDENRTIAVLTEFQVGGGGRVDIMMQVVDNKNHDHKQLEASVSVGLELKYAPGTDKAAQAMLTNINSQIEGYAEGKNIKSITEGKNVAFLGVVFNPNATKKEDLILVSHTFLVANVAHSSIENTGAGKPPSTELEDLNPTPHKDRFYTR